MGLSIWSYQFFSLQLLLLHSLSHAKHCPHEQSSALLQFKQLFHFDSDSSWVCQRSYPKMISWKKDTNCCSWDGVTCDMVTGNVIGLDLSCSRLLGNIPANTSLFHLLHLQTLDLSANDFDYSEISSGFSRFRNLTHFSLSGSNFNGKIPYEISFLSELVSLDLSSNPLVSLETPVFQALVQNMSKLQVLSLDSLEMSSVALDSLKNLSSSLTSLSLSDCILEGNFPVNIFHLPNLHMIRFSKNPSLAGDFPTTNWTSPIEYLDFSETGFSELPDSIGNLKSLRTLMLGYSQFHGPVPASLGNLTQLTLLELSHNNFSGHIPSSLSNLVQLTRLDLSSNSFVGKIPDIANLTQVSVFDLSSNQLAGPIPSHGNRLQNLFLIRLNNNSLSGTIPSWLFSLPLLTDVGLSDNQLSGHIDEFPSRSLQSIYLSNNRLQGSIPSSIFELVNLTDLQLDSNNFSGIVEPYMFAKLIKLKYLYLSHNSLSVGTTFDIDSPFPKFSYLSLSACNISALPPFLITQDELSHLDLSDNKIDGRIPGWASEIGNGSLDYLNLSHNFITEMKQIPGKHLEHLDLRSNLLQGPLPVLPSSLRVLLISNNQFTGEIIRSICDIIALDVLDLSNNRLSGTIPECIGNFSSLLSVLDLGNNRLHGTIPGTFAKSNWLRSLKLNNNELEGAVPRSLVNCTKLEVLDIGNNKVNDVFPYWLRNLPELRVLVLRSNKFHGPVGDFEAKQSFPKLRILDLSINNFSGSLPARFFENLNAMRKIGEDESKLKYLGEDYYQDSVVVTLKGTAIQLQKILTVFTTIDFSGNGFNGEISQVIGKLHYLRLLNLSHNHLTGQIPLSLGNLSKLESLDLSSNNLAGKIPNQLTSLTSLSVLNLSLNRLDGPIPQGYQFDTFQNDSYIGNLGLCGFPLSEKCGNDEAPTTFHEEEEEKAESSRSWFDWKFAKIGYGSGLVIGLSIGYMVFASGEPLWFMKMVVKWQSKKVRTRGNRRGRGRTN